MALQIKINQHYVPRFYLDKFADHERFNWVFDKQHKSLTRKSNKSLCSSDHYYDLPATLDLDNQALFQVIENQLTRVETVGERMIGAILSGVSKANVDLMSKPGVYKQLKMSQIRNLAGYIALQYLRTEAARELIRRENNAIAREFVRGVAERIDSTFDVDKLEWEVNEVWVKWYHILMMSKFSEYTEYFDKKIFVIGINHCARSLITSDNPVVMVPHQYDTDPRLDSLGMRLVFPISPKTAICMYEPRYWQRLAVYDGQPMSISEDDVELFNEMQLLGSRRQVYAAERSDLTFASGLCQRYPSIFLFDKSGEPQSNLQERKRLVHSLL